MGEMKTECLTVGMVQTNCYLVYEEGMKKAVLIDPGDLGKELAQYVQEKQLELQAILITHAHFDHVWGLEAVREAFPQAMVYVCENEKQLCEDPEKNLSAAYGRPVRVRPDRWVKDQEQFEAAGFEFTVITTPGHTEGCCCYYIKERNILFSGDTLFEESVGRTDFPTSSMSALVRSVREKLFVLPEETKVCPGHGGATSIGHEKKYNMFV